jgi:putative transposase
LTGSEPQQILWRRKLQAAYAHPAHADARRALQRLHQVQVVLNAFAANSLAEGFDETLTLHRLVVVAALGVSCKTTNLIENVMSQLERKTQRVARWRTSDQRLRWCAAALLQLEPRLRRIKGCEQLPLLQAALRNKLHLAKPVAA